MTTITMYALFGDDIRILTVDKSGDIGFYIMNIFAIIAFSWEVIASSLAKVKKYFFSIIFIR